MDKQIDLYFSKFKEACCKPRSLQYEDNWLNTSLDTLLSLDFKVSHLSTQESYQKITFILRQYFTMVPPHETLLVAKCCQLILFLVRKQAVQLEKPVLDVALPWFLQAINDSGDLALLDVLQALEAVISWSINDIKTSQIADELLSSLDTELEARASLTPLDVKVWRVQCLKALAPAVNSPINRRTRFIEILSKLLQHAPRCDCEADAQVVKLCLESLEAVCLGDTDSSWLTDILGDILGILTTYLHFGLQGWQYQPPSRLFPLPGAQWEPPPTPNIKSKIKKRQKKRVSNIGNGPEISDYEEPKETASATLRPGYMAAPAGLAWLTSDSEVSDSEGGRTRRLRKAQARVRLAAVNLLVTVAKTVNVRDLFGYYSSLLGSQGLAFGLINDTNPKLREVAASTMAFLLGNAKSYLAQAQHSSVTSYTPFSSVLASILDSLHQYVVRALHNSASMSVLHLASSLVDVSPYHRLRPDLLLPLLAASLPLITHKEVVVAVAAVTVLGCVVAVQPRSEHLTSLLSSPSPPVPLSGLRVDSRQSWVLSSSLQYLQSDNQKSVPVPLRVEWWQVLSNLLQHHFPLVRAHVDQITAAILRDTTQPNLSEHVRLHTLRTLQHLTTSLGTSEADQLECLQVWTRALESQVLALAGESSVLAVSVCDCLSAMSPAAYQHLSEKLQICCVTALLCCARDEEAAVRAAALQALAAYLVFPSFSQDEQFLCDCCEIIRRLVKDPIPLVSGKAAWALGNLTDMLYKNQHEEEIITPIELINISIETAQGKIKVRANGVRSLGNLLGLLKVSHLERPEYKDVPMKAAQVLVKNASSTNSMMKICWNSCYALGSMLKNEALHEISSSWQDMVLQALTSLVVRSSNFKVRTNACTALSCVVARKHYGSQFLAVWRAVLDGLDNAQNTTDFREVKHQDGLLEQLCLTLCHLTSVAEVSDLSSLHEVIVYHLDTMQHHMSRFLNSTVPERTDAVLKAASSVAQLREGTELSTTQNNTLTILSGVFTFDV